MEPKQIDRTHEELRELLGAYALGAVSADERDRFAAHLPTCTTCQAELVDLRGAVRALPLGLDEREPTRALRERIEAAVRADLPGTPLPAPTNGTGSARARTAAPLPDRPVIPLPPRRGVIGPWAVAAAVLLAISLGLLGWNLRLQQELGSPGNAEVVALQPASAAPGASGTLTYLPDRQVALLTVHDLPPLPPGKVYQVWLLGTEGSAPVPSGVFDRPNATHAVAVDPGRYQGIAITAEPGPLGSEGPTSPILAQAAIPPA